MCIYAGWYKADVWVCEALFRLSRNEASFLSLQSNYDLFGRANASDAREDALDRVDMALRAHTRHRV